MPCLGLTHIRSAACLLSFAIGIVQPRLLLAEGHVAATQPVATLRQAVQQVDVELDANGTLHGQFLSSSGVGIADADIQLIRGQQIWQTRTDNQGIFAFQKIPGATYQLFIAGQDRFIRAWAHATAPPQATQGSLVFEQTDVVRGQRQVSPNTNQFFRVAKQRLANPWIFGGIVATAVTIPVAIHNADDDAPATP